MDKMTIVLYATFFNVEMPSARRNTRARLIESILLMAIRQMNAQRRPPRMRKTVTAIGVASLHHQAGDQRRTFPARRSAALPMNTAITAVAAPNTEPTSPIVERKSRSVMKRSASGTPSATAQARNGGKGKARPKKDPRRYAVVMYEVATARNPKMGTMSASP